MSPYHYAGNNPVLYNDPMGDFYGSNGHYVSDRGVGLWTSNQDGGGYANFNNWMNKTMERIYNLDYLKDPNAERFELAKSMADKNTGISVYRYLDGSVDVEYGSKNSYYNVQFENDGKYAWISTQVSANQGGGDQYPAFDKAGYITGVFGATLGVSEHTLGLTLRTYATTIIPTGRNVSRLARLRPEIQALGSLGSRSLGFIKSAGKALGVAGIGITVLDGAVNGFKAHHIADIGIGLITTFVLTNPIGLTIGTLYFFLIWR